MLFLSTGCFYVVSLSCLYYLINVPKLTVHTPLASNMQPRHWSYEKYKLVIGQIKNASFPIGQIKNASFPIGQIKNTSTSLVRSEMQAFPLVRSKMETCHWSGEIYKHVIGQVRNTSM